MNDKPPSGSPRLLGQVRERLRYLHYSLRTEQAYVYWVHAYVHWSGLRRPKDMGRHEVEFFLSYLANDRHVAPATHRQALNILAPVNHGPGTGYFRHRCCRPIHAQTSSGAIICMKSACSGS